MTGAVTIQELKRLSHGDHGLLAGQDKFDVDITGGSISGVDLAASTISLSSPLGVGSGGTGAITLTGILKGNGTAAFTAAIAADFPTLNQNTSGSAATLTTARTIGGVSFNGSANIVPQTIQSVNEASDTTCFPLFISASGTQSLQPLNNTALTFNASTGALGATSLAGAGTGLTGTASGLTAGNVTTNANLTGVVTSSGNATSLGSFTSANLLAALTDETGSGVAVFATSPTLVTPVLGVASATSLSFGGSALSTYITGTFMGACTGAITGNTTIKYSKIGAVANISLPDNRVAGASSNTPITITGMPASLFPGAEFREAKIIVTDNGVDPTAVGVARILTNGNIIVYLNTALAGFTSSANTTGYYGFNMSWSV